MKVTSLNQNSTPQRKWLIVALCDDDTNKSELIQNLKDSIATISDDSAVNHKPDEIVFENNFTWISINDIEPGINSGNDELLDVSVESKIRQKIDDMHGELFATALILDFDLLKRNGLEKYFLTIIKSNYFNPDKDDQLDAAKTLPTKKHPNFVSTNKPPTRKQSNPEDKPFRHKYVFCFGGTPSGKAFHQCNNNLCEHLICSRVSCRLCEDEILINCNHTCCWELVGTLLGAYRRPRGKNQNPNNEIRKLISKKFRKCTYACIGENYA